MLILRSEHAQGSLDRAARWRCNASCRHELGGRKSPSKSCGEGNRWLAVQLSTVLPMEQTVERRRPAPASRTQNHGATVASCSFASAGECPKSPEKSPRKPAPPTLPADSAHTRPLRPRCTGPTAAAPQRSGPISCVEKGGMVRQAWFGRGKAVEMEGTFAVTTIALYPFETRAAIGPLRRHCRLRGTPARIIAAPHPSGTWRVIEY
jgi:hypothetical protein